MIKTRAQPTKVPARRYQDFWDRRILCKAHTWRWLFLDRPTTSEVTRREDVPKEDRNGTHGAPDRLLYDTLKPPVFDRSARSCLGFALCPSHYRAPASLSRGAPYPTRGPRSLPPPLPSLAFPRVFRFSFLSRARARERERMNNFGGLFENFPFFSSRKYERKN